MVSIKSVTERAKAVKSPKSKSGKIIKKKIKNVIEVPISEKKQNIHHQTPSVEKTAKKKAKYTMPSKAITENIVELSLHALNKLIAHQNKKNIIFGDETSIYLEIRCIKIQNTRGNLKFILPHSTMASSGEVCLITPDLRKGKKIDHEPTIEHWEDMLRKSDVTEVKRVLPMRQLRVEYDQYELKRRLMTQHDLILVDTRVISHVSHVLGKRFFKKHNMLTPIKLNEKGDLKNYIDKGLRTAMLRLSEGDTSTFQVGHTGMPQQKVHENIISFVKQLNDKYPGGEANVRSISVKLPLSLSLPLYITLRPSNTILPPKLKQTKPKHFVEYEDEISTIPGHVVRVAPDGSVLVKKNHKDEDSFSMSDDDKDDIEDLGTEQIEMENDDKL